MELRGKLKNRKKPTQNDLTEEWSITPHYEDISISLGKEGTTYYPESMIVKSGASSGYYVWLDGSSFVERNRPFTGKNYQIYTKKAIMNALFYGTGLTWAVRPFVVYTMRDDALSGHNFDENGLHLVDPLDHISYDVTENDKMGMRWLGKTQVAHPIGSLTGAKFKINLTKILQHYENLYVNKIDSETPPQVRIGFYITSGGQAQTIGLVSSGDWSFWITDSTAELGKL